jgi:ribose transport system permease protein
MLRGVLAKPWIWSFLGAAAVYFAAVSSTGGHGAGSMVTAALSLAAFSVIAGLAQLFVITLGPGNVDLSLPANIGLASAVAMKVMQGSDAMIVPGIAAALAVGSVIGIVNYLLIRALRIPPIIATLSASFIIESADIGYGRGLQIKPPPGLAAFADLHVAGIPALAVLALLLTTVGGVALQRMVFGRSVVAIGQNIRAARLAGVAVGRVRCATYALCGLLGGLDGALLAAYFRGASIDLGAEYLLTSIAVVVIGGSSVAGGRSNVAGLWGAALFLVLLQIMLNTFGADAGVRLVSTGLVIIAVITFAGGPRPAR